MTIVLKEVSDLIQTKKISHSCLDNGCSNIDKLEADQKQSPTCLGLWFIMNKSNLFDFYSLVSDLVASPVVF